MATTTQRTAMVQIPLPNWAIFCTAMDSGAIPEARIRPFAYDVLGDYWLTTQPNGAAENTAEDKQQEGAGRRKRQASNAVNTQTDNTIATPARRVRLGGRRDQLISLIRSHPDGLTRSQILTQLGVKGEKSSEMSVSNALTALTKRNQLSREGGRYYYTADTGATQVAKQLATL